MNTNIQIKNDAIDYDDYMEVLSKGIVYRLVRVYAPWASVKDTMKIPMRSHGSVPSITLVYQKELQPPYLDYTMYELASIEYDDVSEYVHGLEQKNTKLGLTIDIIREEIQRHDGGKSLKSEMLRGG